MQLHCRVKARGASRGAWRGASGFTLVEVMVTVAVVGILAALAYPAYSDYVLRGRVVDATRALAAMQTRLEQHYQDNRTYLTTSAAASPCAASVTVKSFTVSCPTLEAGRYTIQAKGSGLTDGFIYTLDYQDVQTTKVPSVWGGSTSACWILKRGEAC
jgi:type IV pilus assembly protein PilE